MELMNSHKNAGMMQTQSVRGVLSPKNITSTKVFNLPIESEVKHKGVPLLNEVSSKLIQKSAVINESSSGIFRQNPSEAMKTFFVEKDTKIFLFKDIQNFYGTGEDNLRLNGKMITYTKEFEYKGDIVNDQMHGQGELLINGKTFIGKFHENSFTLGTIDYGKMIYNGQIKDMKRHGSGKITIGKAVIHAHFVEDLLDETKEVRVELEKRDMGQIEVIPTKNAGMYLLSQTEDDNMFIFDVRKFIFRKSY
jgi:hypothetical protein